MTNQNNSLLMKNGILSGLLILYLLNISELCLAELKHIISVSLEKTARNTPQQFLPDGCLAQCSVNKYKESTKKTIKT